LTRADSGRTGGRPRRSPAGARSGQGREAGIPRRVHPHGLRHTHAAELRAEKIDIGIIARQLGHRSIATTARYLYHIAPVDVVEVSRAGGEEVRQRITKVGTRGVIGGFLLTKPLLVWWIISSSGHTLFRGFRVEHG
jgi:hypothetical protein